MKWFKKLFKCSKKDELKEKTKTLSFESDAKIVVEPGTENKVFAKVLQTAINYGIMNPGSLVTNFIDTYLTEESDEEVFISNLKLEPTEEIKQLCNKLIRYKARIHDHDLRIFVKENSKLSTS